MKVAICSDVHLEFGPLTLENPGDVEVLILSGDICVAADLRTPDPYGIISHARTDRFFDFMGSCSRNFNHVVYVMGNHEHYHGDYAKSASIIRDHLKDYPNIHLLDKEVFEIGDYTFIGGTLWTDMNKEDPLTLYQIAGMMNDYRGVKNSNRMVTRRVPVYKKDENGNLVQEEISPGHFKTIEIGMKMKEEVSTFSPEDSVEDHKAMLELINKTVADIPPWKTVIVVGHHAPSKASTHPRYKKEVIMNGAYSSDLSEIMLNNPHIKLWTHGHTHEDFDYMIGSCRVVCNPRGYDGYESRADRFELKVVEV